MVAFLFPGQGSQYPGMAKEFFEQFSVARQTFEEAGDALGENVARLCFESNATTLALTANAQPAILTTSIAILKVISQETSTRPDILAGHSLGEFSALVAAQCLEFSDAVRMVRKRGEFMQEAVPPGVGKMVAVLGLTSQEVINICLEATEGDVVSPANFNAPAQTVISGDADAVDRATKLAKQKGARRVVELEVSAPFHCPLMRPAAERLAEIIEQTRFHPMRYPVVTNTQAQPNSESEKVGEFLVDQVISPVRWAESLEYMQKAGFLNFFEIGPSKVLCGLVKRTLGKVNVVGIEKIEELDHIKAN